MTFREKLAREHPECVNEVFIGGCKNCPCAYGYEIGKFCTGAGDEDKCRDCWDREMPMTPEEQEAQEKHDLAINAEIIRGYCVWLVCDDCPAEAENVCRDGAGFIRASAAEQRAMLDAFEAALPPLDEDDGGRPQAAPTEENATPERKAVRERLDYLFWEASGKLKAWHETRDGEELEQAVWLLRWMMEIQEGEGWA